MIWGQLKTIPSFSCRGAGNFSLPPKPPNPAECLLRAETFFSNPEGRKKNPEEVRPRRKTK